MLKYPDVRDNVNYFSEKYVQQVTDKWQYTGHKVHFRHIIVITKPIEITCVLRKTYTYKFYSKHPCSEYARQYIRDKFISMNNLDKDTSLINTIDVLREDRIFPFPVFKIFKLKSCIVLEVYSKVVITPFYSSIPRYSFHILLNKEISSEDYIKHVIPIIYKTERFKYSQIHGATSFNRSLNTSKTETLGLGRYKVYITNDIQTPQRWRTYDKIPYRNMSLLPRKERFDDLQNMFLSINYSLIKC